MILLIDNYDSFAYNLYQFVGIAISKIKNINLDEESYKILDEIKVIRNDELSINEIKELQPDIIILSPGPGKPEDAGVCSKVVKEFYDKVPILGVCLGHQVICEVFGGKISYANQIMHGKTSTVTLNDETLFNGFKYNIKVARYHSLALVEDSLPEDISVISRTLEHEIMAVKHKEYPVYGLQFHPESILTEDGLMIITNFIKEYI